jgi:hypothetical protein
MAVLSLERASRLTGPELVGGNFNNARAVHFLSDIGHILFRCLRKS